MDPYGVIMTLAGAMVFGGVAVLLFRAPGGDSPAVHRPAARDRRAPRQPAVRRATTFRAGGAVVLGGLTWWATGWPVAGFAVAGAVMALPALFSGPSQRVVVRRLRAIAGWTERLRDTVTVGSGLTEALQATAAVSAGTALEGPLVRLDSSLRAGARTADALRELAREIGDPMADMVVASLIMAAERDAVRIREVLDALALEAREEADRREDVDASRASARSQMRSVAVSSVVLMVAFAIVGRGTPLLGFYDSFVGQMVLVVVTLIMGSGIWLMGRMVRPTQADRIVLVPSEEPVVAG